MIDSVYEAKKAAVEHLQVWKKDPILEVLEQWYAQGWDYLEEGQVYLKNFNKCMGRGCKGQKLHSDQPLDTAASMDLESKAGGNADEYTNETKMGATRLKERRKSATLTAVSVTTYLKHIVSRKAIDRWGNSGKSRRMTPEEAVDVSHDRSNNIEWKVVDLTSHEHEKERIRAKQDRALNAWEGAKRKVSEINAKLEANAINATQPMSALRISLRAAEAECTRLRVQYKNALHDPRGPPVVDDESAPWSGIGPLRRSSSYSISPVAEANLAEAQLEAEKSREMRITLLERVENKLDRLLHGRGQVGGGLGVGVDWIGGGYGVGCRTWVARARVALLRDRVGVA